MDNHTPSTRTPHPEAPCCSPDAAWVTVRAVAWFVFHGGAGPHVLADAIDHALEMERAAGVPR